MERFNDSQIAYFSHEPKVVGTARCAVTARIAGGTVRMRSPNDGFLEIPQIL